MRLDTYPVAEKIAPDIFSQQTQTSFYFFLRADPLGILGYTKYCKDGHETPGWLG